MKRGTCSECSYWFPASVDSPDAPCHRFPPPHYDGFPITWSYDWCGEFNARPFFGVSTEPKATPS